MLRMNRKQRQVRRFKKQVFDKMSPEAAAKFLTPGASVYGYGAGETDREGYMAVLANYFEAFPDMTVDIEDILVDDDRVAVHWTVTGTNTGPLTVPRPNGETITFDPTGRAVTISGVDLLRFSGGKVVELHAMFDNMALMDQLGLSFPGVLKHIPEIVWNRFARPSTA